MDYRNYEIADFAADISFIEWVKNPDQESALFWNTWLETNPDKKSVVAESKQLVLALSEDDDILYEWELNKIWQNIQQARNAHLESAQTEAKVRSLKFWRNRSIMAAAAVGLLLIISGILWYTVNIHNTIAYASEFGQRRLIQLPDNSTVVLNGNSKISFSRQWLPFNAREIYLQGEAYFSVMHKENNQPFIVHTKDNMRVEVLGTEFNVSDREDINRVVLTSGKVRLHINQNNHNQEMIMEPGELIEVSSTNYQVTKRVVRTELYTSWKDNKLIFENTPLSEIGLMLEQSYGCQVVFWDKGLADKKITAHFDAEKLDDILNMISATFNIKVIKQDNKIILTQ